MSCRRPALAGLLLASALLVPLAGAQEQTPVRLLDRVYFDSGQVSLSAAAREVLGPVARVVSDERECRIRLVGRADGRGCGWCNRRLSRARASAVADELARLEVDRSRVEIIGHGEARSADEPELEGLTAEQRLARARRVDILLDCASAERGDRP